MSQGWTLNDIDNSDFLFFIELLSYKENKKVKKRSDALDKAGL